MRFKQPISAAIASQLLRDLANRLTEVGPRTVDKPLVLYGAGNLGRMAAEYFRRLGIGFSAVVDASPQLYRGDPAWEGVLVLGPDEASAELRQSALLAVCVVTLPFSALGTELTASGWRDVVPFYDIAEAYRDRHPLSNGWFVGDFGHSELGYIDAVLNRWDDDVSRAHHLQFIAWHRLREDWLFDAAPVTTLDRYFIPQLVRTLHDHEVFVDVGAHEGEVIERFLDIVGHHFAGICAIEPDAQNRAVLAQRLQPLRSSQPGTIRLDACAVAEQAGELPFASGLGYASQISAVGGRATEIKTLDELKLSPTFVKLHLEGGELGALKGFLRTLATRRPLVTATAYHNRLGLGEFPKWLMDNLRDYRFLLRLHGWCGTGLVIYAIPCERLAPQKPRGC
jgi:FkbM family methyltransferase